LSAEAVGRINQLLSKASSQNVRPAVNPLTDNVAHPDGTVMVVAIPDGVSKPYMDKNGAIWVKNGSDKRKATSREEIQRMFQSASLVHADETLVAGVGAGDVDLFYFEKFFENEYGEKIEDQKVSLPKLLENMNLAKAGVLNLAGTLLFGKKPEFRLPAFIVKAVAFAGDDVVGETYLDSRDITGRIADMFQQCVGFVILNTGKLQGDQSVNSTGGFEVPRIVWEELIANAHIHRNYFISAPIRLLVFSDRVEIISPGHLPNNLTIANVKAGNSNIRNPILASFAAKLLPYRGLGSGVLRAIKAYPKIDLIDDREGNLFKVVVHRA
jgi:ATP-dependent DNA helicase RecG